MWLCPPWKTESRTCSTIPVNSILQGVLFVCILGLITHADIKRREIPVNLCCLMVIISLLDFNAVNIFGIGAALPFFIAAIIKPSGMGGGDIMLTAAVGLVLGLPKTLASLILGLSALVIFHAVSVLILRKKIKETGAVGKQRFLTPSLK